MYPTAHMTAAILAVKNLTQTSMLVQPSLNDCHLNRKKQKQKQKLKCIYHMFWGQLIFHLHKDVYWTKLSKLLYKYKKWNEMQNKTLFIKLLKNKKFLIFLSPLGTMQPTSVLTKASVWYEIRLLWANIDHVKSHAMALVFSLQTDMNQIF